LPDGTLVVVGEIDSKTYEHLSTFLNLMGSIVSQFSPQNDATSTLLWENILARGDNAALTLYVKWCHPNVYKTYSSDVVYGPLPYVMKLTDEK